MAAIVWILGAWMVMLLISSTLMQGVRLLLVPAGGYLPWRRAWIWLMLTAVALWITFLRNALLVSGLDDAPIHFLNNFESRVILNGLEAAGILGCMTECYRIFRHQPARPAVPAAQVVMDWRGIVRDWSEEATGLLGWTAEEALGQDLADLLIPNDTLVNGQPARDMHRKGLEHFRQTGESPILNARFPTKVLHKTKPPIDVEVYVTAHVSSHGTRFLGSIFPRGTPG